MKLFEFDKNKFYISIYLVFYLGKKIEACKSKATFKII